MGFGEVARHPGNQQKDGEQQIVIAEVAFELHAEERRPRHEQPLPPARHGFPFEQHLLDEKRKPERCNGEVVTLNAQRRQRNERAENGGDDPAGGNAYQERQAERADHQCRSIGSHRPERCVADRDLPAHAEQYVETQRHQRIDHDDREEIVTVVAEDERHGEKKKQQDRRAGHAGIDAHTFVPTWRVNRPCGRNMSTTTMIANANVSLNAVER